MKSLYIKKSAFIFFLVFTACVVSKAQNSTVYFDLDACNATLTGSHQDYSEFTGQITNGACANLNVQGGHLYRNNPTVNAHSCTPGVDGDPAMCIGSNPLCTFTPGSDQALRLDLMVTPGSSGSATLGELSFYEKGPATYSWINGASGPNNYPTLFGIRILKNGTQIYLSTDIPTELSWNLNTINFTGPEFTVTEPTVFNFEFLPYCPVGNGEPVSAWDIDELRVTATCCMTPSGGELSGGPFEFCVGDGVPDHVSGIVLTGPTGSNSQWVVTDDQHNILNLPASIETVNFDGAEPGICLIYHISYEDGLTGLVVGNNLLTDLSGCFGLSNSLSVIRNQPAGGTLTGGPFEFCSSDTTTDVTGIVLSGNIGPNTQWVVINNANTIMSLPGALGEINFEGSGPGTFSILNISFFDTLSGLVIGNNLINDVTGCLSLSNSITVTINQPDGGTLTGGPFEFCVGDSIPDHVSGVVLTGNVGETSQWVVTNDANVILSLPANIDSVNFDGGGPGVCLIWNISYFNSISGLVPGNNLLTDITGCFDLSNSITVTRNQPVGGILTGGPFEFCSGDTTTDVTGIVLSGNIGPNTQWVVINNANTIMSLPGALGEINFEGSGPGTFSILNISFFDTLSGLVIGNNLINDVTGCLSLSNSITVTVNQPDGGTLTGGPFNFCVGDSIPDYVSGVVLTGNVGDNSQWVVTNDSNVILSLPANIDSVNFDGGGPGICLIWNISYFDTLSGLTPGNNLLTDVEGCFDLSNSITVNRNQPEGGNLIGGPFEFCAGDSLADVTSIILTGNVGANSQWVVTNDINTIMSIAGSLDEIQFVGNDPGVFLIWNISYFDTLSGLIVGNNLFEEVTGCSGISDSVIVILSQPDGGTLTGGPFEFCVGDGIPDHVSGIVLTGDTGESSQWVVTDDQNNILSLPASPDSVNFDGGGPGICLIYHVSYDNGISGLEPGNNLLTDVVGCFGLSNPITVVRNQPEGGSLSGGPFEFCVGDSTDVTSIVLSGNVGENSQWVVLDVVNNILSLPDSLDEINLEGSGPGTYLIVNVSYYGTLSGLNIENNLYEDVTGCLAISDSIIVTLSQPVGGVLTGGPFEFCVGDTISDYVSGVVLVGNAGANSQYVVTDSAFTIIGLPGTPEEFDFNNGQPGNYYIIHVSYDGNITGLTIGNNLLADLEGCFSLSNSLPVIGVDCEGLQGGPIFELKVAPNPVRETMTLKMEYSGDELPLVQIFDLNGRLCLQHHHDKEGDMTIEMNNYAEGYYFVRVLTPLGVKTVSIMVTR